MLAATQSLPYQGEFCALLLSLWPILSPLPRRRLNCSCHGKVISYFLPRDSWMSSKPLNMLSTKHCSSTWASTALSAAGWILLRDCLSLSLLLWHQMCLGTGSPGRLLVSSAGELGAAKCWTSLHKSWGVSAHWDESVSFANTGFVCPGICAHPGSTDLFKWGGWLLSLIQLFWGTQSSIYCSPPIVTGFCSFRTNVYFDKISSQYPCFLFFCIHKSPQNPTHFCLLNKELRFASWAVHRHILKCLANSSFIHLEAI